MCSSGKLRRGRHLRIAGSMVGIHLSRFYDSATTVCAKNISYNRVTVPAPKVLTADVFRIGVVSCNVSISLCLFNHINNSLLHLIQHFVSVNATCLDGK